MPRFLRTTRTTSTTVGFMREQYEDQRFIVHTSLQLESIANPNTLADEIGEWRESEGR